MSHTPAEQPRTPPVVAVVGPTAAGKTELSLDLAEALGGEVVNTDSMQVYRGMDIGTAKLPVAERRGIPHHLLDLLEVTEPATVAEFQRWAREVVTDCRARGVTPVGTRHVSPPLGDVGHVADLRGHGEHHRARLQQLRRHAGIVLGIEPPLGQRPVAGGLDESGELGVAVLTEHALSTKASGSWAYASQTAGETP